MTLTISQLQELRHVEAYDLATFLQGVEQAIKDGYEISLEHNETYPYGTIGHYIVKMPPSNWTVQKSKEPVKEVVVEQTTEGSEKQLEAVVEAPKKAGRPAKAK